MTNRTKDFSMSDISDIEMIKYIFTDYVSGNFKSMQNLIREYSEFHFFCDLSIYLRFHYRNDSLRYETYTDIIEKYFNVY